MYTVSTEVIKTYLLRPDRRINIQKLSKKSKVSRAWIYKYFGSNEKQIMLTAIDLLAPLITEASKVARGYKDRDAWLKGLLKSLRATFYEVEEYGDLFRFYFAIMLKNNEYAERVKYHEREYMLRRAIPQITNSFECSKAEATSLAQIVFHIRIGLVFSWLTEPDRTPLKRKQLLSLVRTRILDQMIK